MYNVYMCVVWREIYSTATKGQKKDDIEEGKGRGFFMNIFHTRLCYDVRSLISWLGLGPIWTLMFAVLEISMILDNLTARRAASSKSEIGRIFKPAYPNNTFASSTLVPFKIDQYAQR